jgi:hypothetical protein
MKFTATKNLLFFVLVSLFAPFSMAADNTSAVQEIAGVVAGMNHFASDEQKARLMELSEDESLADGIRRMASTVANIQHFPNDEGKELMARIIANEAAPERGKTLARIIAGFAHMVSAEDKATLQAML